MNIAPAQFAMVLPPSSLATGAGRPARTPDTQPSPPQDAPTPSPAPAELSSPKLNTALRIDPQHHIYYEVINEKSGDIVFEIPPAQIRKLAEGIRESLAHATAVHNLDVKS